MTAALAAIWTLAVAGSLVYHILDAERHFKTIAREVAYQSVEKDILYGVWAAEQGGVYVPVRQNGPSDRKPAAAGPRNIAGQKVLRFMRENPLAMIRGVNDLARGRHTIADHVAVLGAVQPDERPDAWEEEALRTLAAGAGEVGEVVDRAGVPYYRFMLPLDSGRSCLACHGTAGRNTVHRQGGISVSIPMALFEGGPFAHTVSEMRHFASIWGLGMTGILLAAWYVLRQGKKNAEAEAALRAREEIFSAIVNQSRESIALVEVPGGRFVEFNESAHRDLGYTREEFSAIGVANIDAGREPGVDASLRSRIFNTTEESFVTRGWCKNGELRDLRVSSKAITVRGREYLAVLWSDITEQSRSEATIRAIAEKLSVKTGDEYFLTMTEFIARELGMDYVLVGEIRPDTQEVVTIALYGMGKHLDNITYALEGTPCEGIEDKSLVMHESGTWKRFPASGFLREAGIESYLGLPLISGDNRILGVLAAMSVRSISRGAAERSASVLRIMAARAASELERAQAESDRKRLEAQLQQAQKVESVGRLAGGVAHDINNMLMPILGYAEMLDNKMPAGDARKEDIEAIIRSTERIRDVTGQLLAFARKQTITMVPLDLKRVVGGFEKMLRRTLQDNVKIDTCYDPSRVLARGDAGRIEQVILNLAINAQDAMPNGGILSLSVSTAVLTQEFARSHQGARPGVYAMVTVADSGAGMDRETLSKIFEPFFTTKAPGRGTGLGLSMAYGIVKQHGGYIDVSSEPGRGATFDIYFPLIEELGDIVMDEEAADVGGGSETVLVVEDQEDVLRLIARFLADLGYRVLQAGHGADALLLAQEQSGAVDLLLTDVIMPGMNGRELFEELQGERPALKVLYMSGYAADVISTHGVLHSGTNFIQKPFALSMLAVRIREILDA